MKPILTAIAITVLFLRGGAALSIELKDVTYRTEKAGTILFSHQKHLEKKPHRDPLQCRSCHSDGTRSPARSDMARMKKGHLCGECHNGTRAFALSSCTRCHPVREITYRIGRSQTVTFSHASHLDRSPDCARCHDSLYRTGKNQPVGMAGMRKGKSCGACHTGRAAFSVENCGGCHQFRDREFTVAQGGSIRFSHQRHLASSLSCHECHETLFRTGGGAVHTSMDKMGSGESCGACHDGRRAFSVRENCASCHKVNELPADIRYTSSGMRTANR